VRQDGEAAVELEGEEEGRAAEEGFEVVAVGLEELLRKEGEAGGAGIVAREKAAKGGVDGLLGVEDLADAGADDGDVVFAETATEEGLARGGIGEELVLRDGVDEVVQERAAFGGDGCVGEEGHAN
jgi:hypothetical protein